MEDVAMCILTTDTGHVLVNCAVQDTPISVSHLGSLVATLQQFSHGQSTSLLQLDAYSIVVVSSPLIPVMCCLVSTTPNDLSSVKLVGSFILQECHHRHHDRIAAIVQQTKEQAESMAHAYTLSSALLGQEAHDTHPDLEDFQSSCILPCMTNHLHNKIAQALADATLSRSTGAVWIGHVDSPDAAFHWTPSHAASFTLAPWLPHTIHKFHRHLHALSDPNQRQLTLQPPLESIHIEPTRPWLVAVHLAHLDGFCVAVLFSSEVSLGGSACVGVCDVSNPLRQGSGKLSMAGKPWVFRLGPIDPTPKVAVSAVCTALASADSKKSPE